VFEFLRARLRQGTRTARLPEAGDALPERFRGLPIFKPHQPDDLAVEEPTLLRPAPPSALLTTTRTGRSALDIGACLFSPDEATVGPVGTIGFTREYRMASGSRDGLISPTGEVELAHALGESTRRLFGRSLRLRSVVAGSCGGCEAELVALSNVVFDLARFGVQFVASPRHADGLVVTGAMCRNMRTALGQTYEATPAPRIVIAVGACAITGGPFRGSREVGEGVPEEIPVDLYVPGCPPHPLTLLDGILRLLGRLPRDRLRPGRTTYMESVRAGPPPPAEPAGGAT
jgi:Ni,Fe-hydrogenase III small subunit